MPDYYRTNDDGSTDYYDARAGLYYPEDDEPQRPQRQDEGEDEE